MKKCDCYVEDRQLSDYTPLMKPIYKTVSLCFGTKERDRCSCGGDRTKCDFYPEVKEKAIQEENSLIVTYDYCSPDAPTLCIARKEKDKVRILNTIQGDAAFGMYHYLTGGAELKNVKEIAKKPIEIDKYRFGCPCCNEDLGLEKEDIYVYDMTPPKYCSNCGQKLDWE